jgi:2-polyprenyl-6-hydroxyphenyl methylase/3-demethylubiquinone-9 3-methyltransferase
VSAARRAGLEQAAMTGMTYNPLTREYRLVEGDVSVNYLVAFRRPA